jgi:high mobility group protein B1
MNPEYGIGDVAKELGRLWALVAPETKQKYQAMSDKDKARYEREMHVYKSTPTPPAAGEEEEEEESDDEY